MMDEDVNDYEGLLAAGQENARYSRLMEEQQRRAALLREQGAAPQGQMVSGHFVAPNALQHLAALGTSAMSGQAARQAQESGAGLEKSMGNQNSMILKALLRNRSAGQPKPSPYAGMQFNPNADTRDVTPGMDW